MAKRFALIAFVSMLVLLVGAPAAMAAPSATSIQRHVDVAAMQAAKEDATGVSGLHANNAGGQGKSHAPENAGRGMNREGSPGEWKDNGHVPSVNSFPQGHSPSDPDANGNGGLDKPGQTGGFNADRDGNNGCGNDSDREDDNNGWCGKKPTAGPPPPGGGGSGGGSQPPPTVVLGKRGEKPAPATLPRTGTDVGDFLWGGWSLILAGTAMRRSSFKSRRR